MGADTPQSEAAGPGSPPGLGVARITSGIARGEAAALEAHYRAWFDRCYSMARGITRRDEAFCLDVVQDAMMRVVKSMRPMRTEEDLERWMKRVVHTAALDRLREERRRVTREFRAGRSRAEPHDTRADLGERIAWINDQLGAMETHDRMVLLARIGADRTLEQAGAGAGLTGDAAHGRIRRALRRLRAAAQEVFGD